MPLATIRTERMGTIGPFTMQCKGTIIDRGESVVKRIGFVYSLSSQSDPGNVRPELSNYSFFADEKGSFVNGLFDIYLSGLERMTPYYVRAFCQNKDGFSYGAEMYNYTYPNYYPQLYYPIRARENKDGLNYDPNNPKKLFSADLANYDNEILNIEQELGLNPKGSDASVQAKLVRLDNQPGWKYVASGTFTSNLTLSSLNGDTAQSYKIIMNIARSDRSYIWMRMNGDENSRYSYHNRTKGFIANALVDAHTYSRVATAILMNKDPLTNIWLEIIVNTKRNGFESVKYTVHSNESDEDYEFTEGDGIYRYATTKISTLQFLFSGTLDSGNYRLYKMI